MIGYAQQKGNLVYVYDAKGAFLWYKQGELKGYTSNTVTIVNNNLLCIYGEKGEVINYKTA